MIYLLDTNTCIAAMRHHPMVVGRIASIAPGDCVISTIASYELYTGIEKCVNPTKEQTRANLLLNTVHELPFDGSGARESSGIRAHLESSGMMIGP